MQGQTKIQERLKGIQSLIHEIEDARKTSEVTINKFSQSNTPATIKQAIGDCQKEEALIRQALSKIYEIHTIRNESRIQARNSGQKEMLRKGQLMKMLSISAQTLPLYVSKPGEKIPPLVGSIPANSEYTAKSGDMVAALTKVVDKGSDEENWVCSINFFENIKFKRIIYRSWQKLSATRTTLKNMKFMISMRSKSHDMF
jgi:SAGA-associated factor 29